jgi:hypothetical protein
LIPPNAPALPLASTHDRIGSMSLLAVTTLAYKRSPAAAAAAGRLVNVTCHCQMQIGTRRHA